MEGNCVEGTLNFVLVGTDLVACCFRFFSPSPKHVTHRRLSCLILCSSSAVLYPYIAVLFLRGPSSRGSSVYTKTPMYGSQTPMYGSQTPMHGSRTPMYGSQTPTHGDGKTAPRIIYLYLCEIFLINFVLLAFSS